MLFYKMAVIQYFLPIILALFSILTHTDYSQNYSGIIRASLARPQLRHCDQHVTTSPGMLFS